MEQPLTVRRIQQKSSPIEVSPRLKTTLDISRTTLSTTIKNFDAITRNVPNKSSNLNGMNYLYHTDSDSDSESLSTDSGISEKTEQRNPFTHAVEEYKKKTILLGSSRKNKTPQTHIPTAGNVLSPRNENFGSQNVKTIKKILEKNQLDELKAQEVDENCFIANIIKGTPLKKDNTNKNSPTISKKELIPDKTVTRKQKKGKQTKLGYLIDCLDDLKSILDEHKLDIEELEFLEVTSSEEEDSVDILKQKVDVISGDESIRIEKESAREYFERLLQDAKKKEPKEVRDYERMADYALDKSLESLKKTIDDVDITKTESFQHISQRRRMYDSLKRGLGARDFMVGVAGTSEGADELLSKIGLSPITPKTPVSPQTVSPSTPHSSVTQDRKSVKRTKEEDDKVLERLSKPKSHQLNRKNEENKSITHSVATLSEEFLDRMKNFEEMKKSKLEDLRVQMNQKRNLEISFSPRINSNSKTIPRNINSLLSWQKEKNMKQEKLILQKKETELIIDCTFSPEISERSQRLAKKKPNIPLQLRDY